MFISVLELFKIGIGPSSSHTMGPMVAANAFLTLVKQQLEQYSSSQKFQITCTLKGSLSATGKGHATDQAIALGLHGYKPQDVAKHDLSSLVDSVWKHTSIQISEKHTALFCATEDIIFDQGKALPEHPNGLIFTLTDEHNKVLISETYFSIGGGFIHTMDEMKSLVAPLKIHDNQDVPYAFDSAQTMMNMANKSGLTIAQMKLANELTTIDEKTLFQGLDDIWFAMKKCVELGLQAEGILPGGLKVPRRARNLHQQLQNNPKQADTNDWLCAYAMAVNEENAAGHMVVTAPTNGAAGVIPAVLYYFITHENSSMEQVRDFLLTASAIGGIIKHNSSISGAEVGCQGEVGSAAAMAAAGLCAVRGGTVEQVEHAAEIALEHHLGMTCDPVAGLVQVPCIERNGFGAIKAYTAASLAMRSTGEHLMSLDQCIAAMKQTGEEMSIKFKETSLGGLAVTITEC